MTTDIILFIIGLIIGIFIAYIFLHNQIAIKERQIMKETELKLEKWKMDFEGQIRKDTQDRMRATLKGRIGEQFAPLLPMFEYKPSDARFIGSPVDYIVFDGYTNKEPQKIIFIEVKTGKACNLTTIERKIKKLVEEKNVEWRTIAIGEIADEIGDLSDEELEEPGK